MSSFVCPAGMSFVIYNITEVSEVKEEVKMEVNSLRSLKLCATHRTIVFGSQVVSSSTQCLTSSQLAGLTPYLTPFYNSRKLNNII